MFPGKARFTKIQNGKKQDKLLLPLTKTRALLRLHKLCFLPHRCALILNVFKNAVVLFGMV